MWARRAEVHASREKLVLFVLQLLLDFVHNQGVCGLRADGRAYDGHQAVRSAFHILAPV